MRTEQIGEATLYLGDCREVRPTLGRVDCIITDPPYGIGKDGQNASTGAHGGRKAYDFAGWDSQRPASEIFSMMLGMAQHIVIWGGNYFADLLPPTQKWLVWDKGQRINQSAGELAWTAMTGALRIATMNRVKLLMDGAEHPTQKPVALMEWGLLHVPETCETILDPFMGSGSTGVACVKMGKRFVGIEAHEPYFDIACRRIKAEYRQPRLFTEPQKPAVQEALV